MIPVYVPKIGKEKWVDLAKTFYPSNKSYFDQCDDAHHHHADAEDNTDQERNQVKLRSSHKVAAIFESSSSLWLLNLSQGTPCASLL